MSQGAKQHRGIAKTIELLCQTGNEAAVPPLLAALNSPHRKIEEGALEAILIRRSLVGQREILRRMDTICDRWHTIIESHRGRMTQAIRDAILDRDEVTCRNGCSAAVRFREYDLIPTLVNAIEDEANPHADLAATTLLSLTDMLYEELHSPRDYRNRRDPQMVRRNVTVSLDDSTKRFVKHHRRETVEAFLLLAGRDNSTLMHILADPRHSSYLALIHVLQHSMRQGILKLILSYLDDPHAPSALINVMVHRPDERFLELLLRKIGREPSAGAKANLRHVTSIIWLKDGPQSLDTFDDAMQHSALQLVLASGMKPSDQFTVLQHLLLFGTTGGRRAAAEALAKFPGSDANLLITKCLQDPDGQVQASALSQLRPRCMPGALSTLIDALDSPHALARKAAQDALPEYAFPRFAAVFESLSEPVKNTTGSLTMRVDPHAAALLRQEMRSNSGKRCMRAFAMARAMDAVPLLEDTIREALSDSDHLVRVEAAAALGESDSPAALATLQNALHDSSLMVQEAAQASLEAIDSRRRVSPTDEIIEALS